MLCLPMPSCHTKHHVLDNSGVSRESSHQPVVQRIPIPPELYYIGGCAATMGYPKHPGTKINIPHGVGTFSCGQPRCWYLQEYRFLRDLLRADAIAAHNAGRVRATFSRAYYAVYNASKAVRYQVNGFVSPVEQSGRGHIRALARHFGRRAPSRASRHRDVSEVCRRSRFSSV
jgi:hypothetical protein